MRDYNTMADKIRDLIESHKNLLADVSHELRSPLARQRVAIALLERLQTDEQRSMLDRIRAESMRLDELIGRILLLCNLESGQQKPEQAEFSFTASVRQVVEDAEFEIKQTGHALKYSAAGEEMKVVGDSTLLMSAIENVLRNSIRYAQPGTIEITLIAHMETAIFAHTRLRTGNSRLRSGKGAPTVLQDRSTGCRRCRRNRPRTRHHTAGGCASWRFNRTPKCGSARPYCGIAVSAR